MQQILKRKMTGVMLSLLLCGSLTLGTQVWATEGGGGAYPNGAEDFMVGAAPPPGVYFINYFEYFNAPGLKNNSGDNALPKFHLNVYADVFRFIYMTKETFLGGNWGMHIFIPIVHMDTEVPGANGHRTGFGDVIIDPFILSWHWKNFHLTTGMDLYLPTGSFNANPLTPLGRNYWTFEPVVAGTFLTDSGFQISAKLMYDFNTVNPDTNYMSGQEFHLDYLVAQKVKNIDLGVGGYYYQQTTDDSNNGTTVQNNKGMALAVGPAVKYDYKNMSFTLKYYFELETYNRPQGNSLWAKFMYAF